MPEGCPAGSLQPSLPPATSAPTHPHPPPPPGRRYLSRPYGRVDRPKLKRRLLERCVAQGVTFHRGKVRSVRAAAVQQGAAERAAVAR